MSECRCSHPEHGGTIRERNEGRGQTASRWSALYRCADKYVLTDEYKMAFTRQAEFISLFYELAGAAGLKPACSARWPKANLTLFLPECSRITPLLRNLPQP